MGCRNGKKNGRKDGYTPEENEKEAAKENEKYLRMSSYQSDLWGHSENMNNSNNGIQYLWDNTGKASQAISKNPKCFQGESNASFGWPSEWQSERELSLSPVHHKYDPLSCKASPISPLSHHICHNNKNTNDVSVNPDINPNEINNISEPSFKIRKVERNNSNQIFNAIKMNKMEDWGIVRIIYYIFHSFRKWMK